MSVDGKTTENGSHYYIAEIKDEEVHFRLYFILGDYKCVKMQATSFDGDEEVFEVADYMADTFVWSK